MLKHGDTVFYKRFDGTVARRTVDYVKGPKVYFTTGSWMPLEDVFKEVEEDKKQEHDPVNSPAHYTQGGIETLDILRAKMNTEQFKGFLRGNVIKYITRYEDKNGVEDLKKAEFYLQKLIKVEEC